MVWLRVARAPEKVRIKLLGGIQVSVGSREIDESQWQLRKAASMLKLLALSWHHLFQREQGIEPLWSKFNKGEPSSPSLRQPSADELDAALTRREREIAALVARGLTSRQIALELSISEHTSAKHVAKILKSPKVSSRTQFAARMTEQGLLSPDPY